MKDINETNIVPDTPSGATKFSGQDIEAISKQLQQSAEHEESISGRTLSGWQANFVYVVSILFVLFQFITAGFGEFGTIGQRATHLFFGIIVCYSTYSFRRKSITTKIGVTDWILLLLGAGTMVFAIVETDYILSHPIIFPTFYVIMGVIAFLIILEGCRRMMGWIFPILVAIFMGYAFFGSIIPGTFAHKNFSFTQVFTMIYLNTSGLFGSTVGISATTIATFLIFGAVLLHSGAGETFLKLAMLLAGHSVGGAAKVAVITSALFGTISGSAAANVATVGTFTIPLMKRSGYRAEFAAGVEAVASTGGQIMPPIMGSGAFVMAEFLGIPYSQVAILAIAPAVIFFAAIFIGVHLEARKQDLSGKIDLPNRKEIMHADKLINLLGPLLTLFSMFWMGFSPGKAAYVSIIVTLVLPILTQVIPKKITLKVYLKGIGKSCQGAALTMASIAVLVAAADIVCSLISMTGLSVKISNMIISLAGTSPLLALILTALVVIILGMGLPTTAAYVLGAAVLAPALIGFGIAPIPTHFFIFFFSILGAITPPVCGSVLIGAGIAKANWVKTAGIAMTMGVAAYLVPFAWIYNPSLLMQKGTTLDYAISVFTISVSILVLGWAFKGWVYSKVHMVWRVVLAVLGIGLIGPRSTLTVGYLVAIACMYIFIFRRQHKKALTIKSSLDLG